MTSWESSILLLSFFQLSCGEPEYSPWQTNVSERQLTQKALDQLAVHADKDGVFRIAVIGDTQLTPESFADVRDTINTRGDIDFTVLAGDITDTGLRKEFEWMEAVIDGFSKPLLAVVGNHDGLNHGHAIYKKMFGPLNYSFIYRGIRFVMWNNNSYESNVDVDWLEQEVSQNHPTVVVSHQPPFESALSDGEEKRWHEMRKRENYIASLHAHVHRFDYELEDSQTHIIVVKRVLDTNYSVVEFDGNKVKASFCRPNCEEMR